MIKHHSSETRHTFAISMSESSWQKLALLLAHITRCEDELTLLSEQFEEHLNPYNGEIHGDIKTADIWFTENLPF